MGELIRRQNWHWKRQHWNWNNQSLRNE